ncbi:MAG: hypothetical protein KF696_09910 [Planctomycetes bacterium]|nr:hypothetical protein [Planctomycetota bacterium]MCW8136172.1 hypothetical protein [Planctomycetota bacterium]
MKALLFALFLFPACCLATPTISVTANGQAIPDGGYIEVLSSQDMASLQLEIAVSGNDTDPVALAGTVSDVTIQAIHDSEFCAAPAIGPYIVAPSSGWFICAPLTHTISLAASDGVNADATFVFEIRVRYVEPKGPFCNLREGTARDDCACCAAGPSAGAPLAVLFALLARRRRRE